MEAESQTKWVVIDSDLDIIRRLSSETGLDEITARLLVNRGIETPQQTEEFLSPSMNRLHDPLLLPDMEKGIDRLASAIKSGERICVHGDYDVDGVTSTALLVRTISALDGKIEYMVPHRQKDGYGIKPPAVETISGLGCSLIVTCDCGISACDTVEYASELGLDVIITDHHEPGPELPRALAVIDPKRRDSDYPFSELAGVGVAFKLAQGLVRKMGHSVDQFNDKFVDLAALGTVADVVPLLGENRTIVKHGLEAIPRSKKLGFKAMLDRVNFAGKALTSFDLAFILAPRINAVGRMDDALTGLRLFLTRNQEEASKLASVIEQHNSDRKVVQEGILEEATEQALEKVSRGHRVLVLSSEGWNAGVVGIVAGRLCEQFNRPTVMICRDPETGIGVGSARSLLPYNIIAALGSARDLLMRHGGHTLAAGLSIELENIDKLEEHLNLMAEGVILDEDLIPRIEAEAELGLDQITRALVDNITKLEPFGEANPEPLFISRNVGVLQRGRVGDGSHMRMTVQGKDTPPVNAIAFRMGDWANQIDLGDRIDICYNIRLNSFNGATTVQLVVKAIRAHG